MTPSTQRLLVVVALAAAVPAQDWTSRLATRWPGASITKASAADLAEFVKQNGGDTKAGWTAFLAAQHLALGLPVGAWQQPTTANSDALPRLAGVDALRFETEPNDTAAQAEPISPADHVEATLAPGDRDWFTFTLPTAGNLWLYTGTAPGGVVTDTVLELYDAQSNLLAVNDDSRGLLSTIHGFAQPGTYFARVRHYDPTGTGAYALDVALQVATPTIVEGPEPNGGPNGATPFAPGVVGEGAIAIAADQDWWTFTLDQPMTLVADTGAASIGQPLQDSTLTLWDAAGTTQLAFDDDAGPGLFARLVVPLPAGTYQLAVGGYGNSVGRYSLRLDATVQQNATIAEAPEPNDTPALATQFGPSFLGTGDIGVALDHDLWRFTVTQNVRLVAGTGPGATGTALLDPTLALRQLDGTLIAFDDDGGPDLQAQLYVEIPQGTYLLDVAAYQQLTGTYTLSLVALPGQNAAQSSYLVLGGGCMGSNGLVPQWTVRPFEVPLLGTTLVGEFRGLPGNTLVIGFAGLSAQITTYGTPLPFPLAPLGAPGCSVDVDPFVTAVLFANGQGDAQWGLGLPANPAFLNVDLFQQGMVLDPAANALGVTTTNSGRGVIGERL